MTDIMLHRVLPMSKRLIAERLHEGETAVDMTAGNGNDTQFLAETVGENGKVIAFDIQQQALDATEKRLGPLNSRVSLILDSHANLTEHLTEEIGGAMFNLGYLPYSSDQTIITKPDSTIAALHAALGLLKKSGMITISVYDGHEGGSIERDALLEYVGALHQADVHAARYELLNQRQNPPFLIALEKLRDFTEVRTID